MSHEYVTTEEFKKNSQENAENFSNISKRFDNSEEERKKRHDEIMALLTPIAETYKSATDMGKWVMGGAVFLSILLGIVLSIFTIFKK